MYVTIPSPKPCLPLRCPGFPLPPYRYVPGLQPHPLKHPEGHRHEGPPSHLGMDPCWRHGQDLFDHRFYWEAHEVWERLWKSLPRSSAKWFLVRGMIQASASVLKRHMDHIGPSVRLWNSAQISIAQADGEVWGLDMPRSLLSITRYHGGGDWPVLAPRAAASWRSNL